MSEGTLTWFDQEVDEAAVKAAQAVFAPYERRGDLYCARVLLGGEDLTPEEQDDWEECERQQSIYMDAILAARKNP